MQLRHIRKEKGLTQIELAQITGYSQAYISTLEKGERQPTLNTLKAISEALNVSIGELANEPQKRA